MRKATFGSHVIVGLVGNLFPPLAALVMAPFLAQILGASGRGEVAAATAPFLLAASVASLGLPDAVTQGVAAGRPIRGRARVTVLLLTALSSAVAAAGLVILAPILGRNGSSAVTSLIAMTAVAIPPTLLVALMRGSAAGRHLWKHVAAERSVNGIVKIIGVFALAGSGHLTLMSATVLIVTAPVLGGFAYAFQRRDVTTVKQSGSTGRGLASYGMRAWLGSIAGVLIMRLDQVLVMPLSNAVQLGYYAVAVNISEIPLIVSNVVREVMFSADASRNDNLRVATVARLSLIVSSMIAAPMAATSFLWIGVVFGSSFSAAVPSVVISCAAVALGAGGSIAGSALAARGRPGARSFSILAGCVVNVAMLLVLVPAYGAFGASLATLIGNLVSSNGCILAFCRLTKTSFFEFYRWRWSDCAMLYSQLRALLQPRRAAS